MSEDLLKRLQRISKTYPKIVCKEGRYKEVRLETAFESFEFTPNSSGQVYNMLHIPKLGTEHMQFQGGVKNSFYFRRLFYICKPTL